MKFQGKLSSTAFWCRMESQRSQFISYPKSYMLTIVCLHSKITHQQQSKSTTVTTSALKIIQYSVTFFIAILHLTSIYFNHPFVFTDLNSLLRATGEVHRPLTSASFLMLGDDLYFVTHVCELVRPLSVGSSVILKPSRHKLIKL